jgi:hypothetical protein
VAAAATGRILSLPPPFTNATYRQTLTAPYTQCQKASAAVAAQIDVIADRSSQALDVSTQQVSLDYFAVVPALNSLKDGSLINVQIANLSSFDAAMYASTSCGYISPVTRLPEFHQNTARPLCELSVIQRLISCRNRLVKWHSAAEILTLDVLNQVYYPANASTSADSDNDMAYSALMWALSNPLTGSIGFYKDVSTSNDTTNNIYPSRTYSKITTNIAQTVLIEL